MSLPMVGDENEGKGCLDTARLVGVRESKLTVEKKGEPSDIYCIWLTMASNLWPRVMGKISEN
jgi:hypothetical protein